MAVSTRCCRWRRRAVLVSSAWGTTKSSKKPLPMPLHNGLLQAWCPSCSSGLWSLRRPCSRGDQSQDALAMFKLVYNVLEDQNTCPRRRLAAMLVIGCTAARHDPPWRSHTCNVFHQSPNFINKKWYIEISLNLPFILIFQDAIYSQVRYVGLISIYYFLLIKFGDWWKTL